jgi:Raf kinase inhibitor-like YbhB/YbcL family protein
MGGSAGSGMNGMSGAVGAGSGGKAGSGAGGSGGSSGFTLTSSVLTDGGMFPDASTCASTTESSPDFMWTAGPSGTMSYALILLDTQNSLNHWIVWDIPPSVTSLPAMLDTAAMLSMPAGAKQKPYSGTGYFGPCPQGTDHLYKFTLYALPVATLSGVTTSSQTSAISMAIMSANPLASASLSSHSAAKPPAN